MSEDNSLITQIYPRRYSAEMEFNTKSSIMTESSTTLPIPIKKPNLPTPNLVLPTVDGYTVSHSLLVDNLPTDCYGFILDERFGITPQAYRSFEKQYGDKYERQTRRWAKLVPLVRGDLVVFPHDSDLVKKALRKGLPRELRPKAWYFYSGAQSRQEAEPKKYVELVKLALQNVNPHLVSQIESDISHTFTNNRRFRVMNVNTPGSTPQDPDEPPSHSSMKRILLAIAYAFPSIVYTNGLNSIAATLLLVTQDEQRSFWILYCIIEKLLPENFYADLNLGCNVDQDVLTALIAWKLPAVHKKLMELEMSLHIVTSTWFTHLFVDQLPFESLLRVWDCFLHEGSKVIFRVAIALFKINQAEILKIHDPFELAGYIRTMPRKQLDVINLMDTALNRIGGLSASWLESERIRATPYWKAKHAVRRFSRVSPAYCQAPMKDVSFYGRSNSVAAPVVLADSPRVSTPLRMALDDFTPIFEQPEGIDARRSSTSSPSIKSHFTTSTINSHL